MARNHELQNSYDKLSYARWFQTFFFSFFCYLFSKYSFRVLFSWIWQSLKTLFSNFFLLFQRITENTSLKKCAHSEKENQSHVPSLSEFLTIFWHWNWIHTLQIHESEQKKNERSTKNHMHIALVHSVYLLYMLRPVCCPCITERKHATHEKKINYISMFLFSLHSLSSSSLSLSLSLFPLNMAASHSLTCTMHITINLLLLLF